MCCLAVGNSSAAQVVIDAKMYHLGTPGFPEWSEFEGGKPHGRDLHLEFDGDPNPEPKTLLVRQEGVKQGWGVYLNGKRLDTLSRTYAKLDRAIGVPKNAIRKGVNKLSIRAPKQVDDVIVGNLRLVDGGIGDAFASGIITAAVTENGKAVPCRITIAHPDGTLAALLAKADGEAADPAFRPGVIYPGNGRATIYLLPGEYTVYASRGFEYSLASRKVNVVAGKVAAMRFRLRREVDTAGWVVADTHIHVRDFSGHGDSTVKERMMTIAGEGVELAIATDHNHHADYYPYATEMKVSDHFTSVIGNEVTTKGGHFNAFPIAATAPVPDFKQTNWSKLIKGIRDTAGVKVIVLNHPRNVHSGYSPVSSNQFNHVTGAHVRGIGFDALEVVTSAAMQSDIMALFHDWFALLNRGHRVVGVGSSDTHDVARFAVGQARTYVQCPDTDVSQLDVAAACRSFLNGRALISMGLLTKIRVNDRYEVGDTVTGSKGALKVQVEVTGPDWVSADRVELFANGRLVERRELKSKAGIVKAREVFSVGPFANDFHLIAVATGPGVRQPYWETPRPYQPTSKVFNARLIGATNPVWVDGDGNGRYSSPYETAGRLVKGGDLASILARLGKMDSAVATQTASRLLAQGTKVGGALLAKADSHVRDAFARVRASVH